MGNETIELAQNIDWGKVKYPVCVQRKFDGVPLYFSDTVCKTRQGEDVKCFSREFLLLVQEVLREAQSDSVRLHLVGEACYGTAPFKTTSGLVRRQQPLSVLQEDCIKIHVFDVHVSEGGWLERYKDGVRCLSGRLPGNFEFIRTHMCYSRQDVEAQYLQYVVRDGHEGIMLHDPARTWSPGKRCWGLQRWKQSETLDLEVVCFEEAVSKYGDLLGMVGRINVLYNGNAVGVGPGALTHAERVRLWRNRENAGKYVVEVKFKPDESYSALREASVKSVRYDKMERTCSGP